MTHFDCGCEISLPINWDTIPDCSHTWDTICEGNTKGIFQLESGLGRSWAKKIRPRSIEELSDLIAVLRPGVLESKIDDKSLTLIYAMRKHGEMPVTYIHQSLEPILSSTYGILVYQEQALLIARDIAGYTLSEADVLRKVIGKKKAEEMTKQKDLFIDGCKKTGIVDADTAKDIFDWIEKSQRYSFNKSHSVSYAMIGYQTAYAKTHYTKEFICASLRYAHDKPNQQEEVAELVSDCKNYNIPVNPPYINKIDKESFHIRRGQVYFGPTDIKKFGISDFEKLKKNLLLFSENQTTISEPRWEDFLFSVFFVKNSKVSKTAVENLIMTGGLDYLSIDRQRMKYEYSIYSELTEKEREWINNVEGDLTIKIKTAIDSYDEYQKDKSKKHLKSLSSLKRQEKIRGLLDLLERPPHSLEDSDAVNLLTEKKLLGTPVTVSVLTGYNTYLGNCTCANFKSGFEDDEIIICAKIARATEYTVKSGKNAGKIMCFLTIEDDTTSIECVVFANDYLKLQEYLYEGNILAFIGVRSYDGKSFSIKNIKEI